VSYALGQPVPLRALVRNATGDLANATTVVLTITLPDGTTATPTVTNPPTVTGTYAYDYTPTAPGLFGVQWAFTGTNAAAPPVDSFYVETAALPLVSLAEARDQLRITSTADDAVLQRFLQVASGLCDEHTRVWRRQTLSVVKDGGGRFVRLRRPAISVTSVTESGIAVAASGYTLDGDRGWLYRGDPTSCERWAWGTANVAVTYVAGQADGIIPAPIRDGVMKLTQHLWDSRRGGSGLPRQAGVDFTYPTGFAVPNAVLELWRPWMPELIA
jgi:hypothetical protein